MAFTSPANARIYTDIVQGYGAVGQTRIDQKHAVVIWYNPQTQGTFYQPCYIRNGNLEPYKGRAACRTFDAADKVIHRSLRREMEY